MAVRQPVRVGLVEMLEKRIRIQDPEHVARRDTRLETALASFSHLLNLEACRFGFAGELVHRLSNCRTMHLNHLSLSEAGQPPQSQP